MKSRYQRDIAPIELAITKKDQLIKEQRDSKK